VQNIKTPLLATMILLKNDVFKILQCFCEIQLTTKKDFMMQSSYD
jgi:hypothetical protein